MGPCSTVDPATVADYKTCQDYFFYSHRYWPYNQATGVFLHLIIFCHLQVSTCMCYCTVSCGCLVYTRSVFSRVWDGDRTPEDQQLFLCERSCFVALCEGFRHRCVCDWPSGVWNISSTVQVMR